MALLSSETFLKETLFQKKNTTKSKKKKEIEKFSQTKMDLTKLTQNEEIPIVVTTNFDVDLFLKGYHEYKSIWTRKIGEI